MIKVIIKRRSPSKVSTIYLDGKPYSIEALAARCNIGLPYLREALHRPDHSYRINSWIAKADAGIPSKARTYYHKDCPVWLQDVLDQTGCKVNSGTKRLKEWMVTGDYDRLYRPVTLGRGPKIGTKYGRVKTVKPKEIKKKVKTRRAVESLRPVGSWEAQNL